MNYIEQFEATRERIWKDFIRLDGIKEEISKKDILNILSEDKVRIQGIINAGLPCTPTVVLKSKFPLDELKKSMESGGFSEAVPEGYLMRSCVTNYFIVNDLGYGAVCEKCSGRSYIVLLQDKDYTENLDRKVWLPSIETYYSLNIPVDDIGSRFPIPVNPEKDLWICPTCNEVHSFGYDGNFGLIFDQEAL